MASYAWMRPGMPCCVISEEADWAGSVADARIVRLEQTTAVVQYDHYEDDSGAPLQERVKLTNIVRPYPQQWATIAIKPGMAVEFTLGDDTSRWPAVAVAKDKDSKWIVLAVDDKSLKKASTIRVAADFNDGTNMFELRRVQGWVNVKEVKEKGGKDGEVITTYQILARLRKEEIREARDRFIPIGNEDHPLVAAAAADATQWILAEELGYKLDEVPGWDDLGKWNFAEVDAPEKVIGYAGGDPKDYLEGLTDKVRAAVREFTGYRGGGGGGGGGGANNARGRPAAGAQHNHYQHQMQQQQQQQMYHQQYAQQQRQQQMAAAQQAQYAAALAAQQYKANPQLLLAQQQQQGWNALAAHGAVGLAGLGGAMPQAALAANPAAAGLTAAGLAAAAGNGAAAQQQAWVPVDKALKAMAQQQGLAAGTAAAYPTAAAAANWPTAAAAAAPVAPVAPAAPVGVAGAAGTVTAAPPPAVATAPKHSYDKMPEGSSPVKKQRVDDGGAAAGGGGTDALAFMPVSAAPAAAPEAAAPAAAPAAEEKPAEGGDAAAA